MEGREKQLEDIVILDTGILFDFLADREGSDIAENLLRSGKGAVSTITLYELFRGVTSTNHIQQRSELASFLYKIDITEHVARKAGQIYTELKNKGNLIDNEVILIGATALYHRIPKLLLYTP